MEETDPVRFSAEFYNDNAQLVNTPDAELVIINSAGDEYPFSFGRRSNYYFLDAGVFPPDDYVFRAKLKLPGKNLQASGKFSVKETRLELANMQADFGLLRRLSQNSGGRFFSEEQIEALKNRIINSQESKPIIYESSITASLLHKKWYFFILLLLLSAEWFLRRYYGSY